MNLPTLIADIANQAEDFLDGTTDRKLGRAGIEEFITIEHPDFDPVTRKHVVDGVMAALEAEDYFGAEFVGDPFATDEKESDD